MFIDLFLSSFKYIRIVFFFFLFSFRTDIDLRGRPMGFIPINAAIRDIRIDYNNTLPEAKRYFFFKLRLRARKIIERERESIIPLTDNNFSLKSLIFLKHFHPRFKYFLEPTPFVHALVSSPRDDRISSFFHWINAKVLCEREKRVCIYI